MCLYGHCFRFFTIKMNLSIVVRSYEVQDLKVIHSIKQQCIVNETHLMLAKLQVAVPQAFLYSLNNSKRKTFLW